MNDLLKPTEQALQSRWHSLITDFCSMLHAGGPGGGIVDDASPVAVGESVINC
jgi:hypothetical protein